MQQLGFRYFPAQKNTANQDERLLLQPKSKMTKGWPFHVDSLLYVDDEAFLFKTLEELAEEMQMIYDHFTLFDLQIACQSKQPEIENRSNVFPTITNPTQKMKNQTSQFQINDSNNNVYFNKSFNYLGSIITP